MGHLYRMMLPQSPHHDTTPVVRNIQNQQKFRSSGNSQLSPAKRRVSPPAGMKYSTQAGSSVASTIHGQNSTPSSSVRNSGVADITQRVTSTPSATQRHSINTLTAMLGTSSDCTLAPGGTSQTDTMCRVVSRPTSGICSTPTPLRCLDNLPTPIPNPEAEAIIPNPLQTWDRERNWGHRQWQLHPQAVSTPWSVVRGSLGIDLFVH